MHEILPQKLWLGNALDARNPAAIFEHQIAAVVDLAYEEPSAQLPREIIYCRIPLLDGAGNNATSLRLAIRTVVLLLGCEVPLLVCCSAGVSRSPAVASFALSQFLEQPPLEAAQRIAAVKTLEIHGFLWEALENATSEQ